MVLSYSFFFIIRKKECWCNTYSGWPGPLENPYRTNIPALYGNPKYMSDCHYKYTASNNIVKYSIIYNNISYYRYVIG